MADYAGIRGYLWRLSGDDPELVEFHDSEIQGSIETIGPGWKSGIWLFLCVSLQGAGATPAASAGASMMGCRGF